MRVLHVIPSLSSVHGGPSLALLQMEKALAALGLTVETATTDDDGPGRHNGKACGQGLRENGAVHWYFRKNLDFFKPSLAFARWIMGAAAHYDLLHIHALFSFTTPVAAWAARRARVPYVIRPLGTLNRYGIKQRRPLLKKLSMIFIDGPVLRGAAAVHFTSEQEAAEARELGIALREAIIPVGIEVPRGCPPMRPVSAAPCVLFLSRLDPKKNVEGLLEALALLHVEMPAIRLVVAGDGAPAYVAELKGRAASLGLADRVTWAGYVEGTTKADAFARADIFVLPSFSENFGIAAAEALAAGLPCVLSDGVAIAEDVVRAGAGVAVATDPRSIAAGLRQLLGQPELLAAIAVRATELAQERYSAAAMGTNLKRLYEGILERTP